MTKIRLLLLLLALCIGLTHPVLAQLPIEQAMRGYRDNALISLTPSLTLLASDTSKAITVRTTYGRGSTTLTTPQPSFVRSGLTLTLRFSSSLNLPSEGFYEVRVDNQVRFIGVISIDRSGIVIVPAQGSILTNILSLLDQVNTRIASLTTTISPVGDAGAIPSTDRAYPLMSVPPNGHMLIHNKGTPLVDAIFYRKIIENGLEKYIIDRVWDINRSPTAINANEIIGVPGETFTGYVVLKFTPITSN